LYRGRAQIYDCVTRTCKWFAGVPRAKIRLAQLDCGRWMNAHAGEVTTKENKEWRKRLRGTIKKFPREAIKMWNELAAPQNEVRVERLSVRSEERGLVMEEF
jgi:uncharacterized protein (UPF0303 family)